MENKSVPFIGTARHRIVTDGEGVTTLVCFHGCPLRCKYCLNPQSLSENFKWKSFTPQELYDKVKIDDLYFTATNGGVTFGGGEPLLQMDFIEDFRVICGGKWRLYAETSLNVPLEFVVRAANSLDGFIVDVKDTNPDIYKAYTGRENTRMLANLLWLFENFDPQKITLRVPLIPDFNTDADVEKSMDLLKSMGGVKFERFTYVKKDRKEDQ